MALEATYHYIFAESSSRDQAFEKLLRKQSEDAFHRKMLFIGLS